MIEEARAGLRWVLILSSVAGRDNKNGRQANSQGGGPARLMTTTRWQSLAPRQRDCVRRIRLVLEMENGRRRVAGNLHEAGDAGDAGDCERRNEEHGQVLSRRVAELEREQLKEGAVLSIGKDCNASR